MGSLAGLLKGRGWEVTGSDEGVYPPMSTALEGWGIPVQIGFSADHVRGRRPDLVVIGNAVRPDNVEARAAMDDGLPVLSFPDALYEHAIRGRHSVVVTGTHGKTTTTSLIATLLHELGRDPSMLVGGITVNFDGSFREGDGPDFVVEGDEYDTVFFDKTPKFLHYHPKTLIITSIEFDHADIYRDLAHIQEQFRILVSRMPADGTIIAAGEAKTIDEVLTDAPCPVVRYGVEEGDGSVADLVALNLETDEQGCLFDLRDARRGGDIIARPRLGLVGGHNVANALAGLLAVEATGASLVEAAGVLERYRGVKRRQEIRGEAGGVLVIDDFAHHPTAVRATVEALAARYAGRRIVAVFEPRSNTSRRALFQDEYARAFAGAGHVVVAKVDDAPIYSATGDVKERLSAERLADDLLARGVSALACEDVDAIVEHLAGELVPGDVVVTLSNGSFDGIWDKLLARLDR
ncbi:MAG: UDP-N-acetylmuramate dehydrogenase [Deltaproteobacteria bacterium]|nr:UDP-N-acetylmuramate dehydrogenase [Deltaproteobacteria bacterium]MBW2394887.1 UDP-N-acetylmuramate dehydrogenase [Deltaproteobacteria bacterium]